MEGSLSSDIFNVDQCLYSAGLQRDKAQTHDTMSPLASHESVTLTATLPWSPCSFEQRHQVPNEDVSDHGVLCKSEFL
ncbi:hypothetical protein TNCV_1389641 [Trichonephila clavipes]|nr:hypothetical protein TNCV_1389641 [Trichonephila clavipes]